MGVQYDIGIRRVYFIEKILSTFMLGLSFEFDCGCCLLACSSCSQINSSKREEQEAALIKQVAVQVGVGRQWRASCPVNNYDDSKKCRRNNNEECWFIICCVMLLFFVQYLRVVNLVQC